MAGLRAENDFVTSYEEELAVPHKRIMKRTHLRGIVFGFAQAAPFFAYAVVMYYGGYLIREAGLGYNDAFK